MNWFQGSGPVRAALGRALRGLRAMALVGGLVAPVLSHAAWETLSAPRDPDRNCGAPHDRAPTLRNSDNRPLLVRNGTRTQVEVYGHLLDTIPSASMSGAGGGSAQRTGGHAGAVNGARGCGAIGSIVVHIDIPRDAPNGARGELVIGGERIALEVRRAKVLAQWSDDNDASTLDNRTQAQVDAERQGAADASRQTAAACVVDCTTRRAACDIARPALEAARAAACQNTTCISFLRSCADQQMQCQANCSANVLSFSAMARQDTAARCLRDLGGLSSVLADGTLEIWLPDVARDRLASCMAKSWFVSSAIERGQGVVSSAFGQPFGASDGLSSAVRANSPDWSVTPSDAAGVLRLSLASVRTLVGRLEGQLRLESAAGNIPVETTTLRYRVHTLPANGVRRLTPTAAAVRQAGPISVAVETHHPVAQLSVAGGLGTLAAVNRPVGQLPTSAARTEAVRGNLSWALSPASGLAVDRCFDSATGTTQVSVGSSRGAIELPAKASSACDGASFTLEAWLGSARPQAGEPFVAKATVGMGRLMVAPAPTGGTAPRPALEGVRRP